MLTYPVRFKNGTFTDQQTGETREGIVWDIMVDWDIGEFDADTDTCVWANWEGGNRYIVSLDDLLFPTVESVNRIRLPELYKTPDFDYEPIAKAD